MKYGITESVKTINSKIKIKDIVLDIVEKKANAIKYFLEGEEFKQAIIFGAYLSGSYIAHTLIKDCEEVIIVDIHPHLKDIIFDERIKFMDLNKLQLELRNKTTINPDLVVDLTGLGGISTDILSKLDPKVLIVEDPKGNYDKKITGIDNTSERISFGNKKGVLKTYRSSKVSKTSGTMTLVIDIITDACKTINEIDGVLYVIPNLKYFEGTIFHEKDVKKFLMELNTPAITVSSIDYVEYELDEALCKNISRVNSYVETI
ncbi:conserved hypothetical protein [Methanococcus vannielii SB]|jgi:hypothetical protein|uniref:DUF1188 domain-containing protein n=1 Tax=Methanococcus vannielii (strain ATCC 35089 / DSM 1224 / JCM 13029 / OCM 148 / SB) TaxID=406327 RepID=A6UQE1_METVS|nr:SAM-dependent methyltransferase HcgC family protein [Methanococcus vannielii]ABR54713.1 conserved hypothetical protein [Methanococcus vannielii SB]